MKRIAIIITVLLALFAIMCLSACECSCGSCDFCTCEKGVQLTVLVQECYSCSEACENNSWFKNVGEETLEGYYMECGCYDWYCFPGACGTYGNTLTSDEKYGHNFFPSCVGCGFDFCLWECYGDTGTIRGSDFETREVVEAQLGVDYTVEAKYVIINGKRFDCTNGSVDISHLDEDGDGYFWADIQIEIHFTALKELCAFQGIATVGNQVIYKMMGNGTANEYDVESERWKSLNIKEGKHILTLDYYEYFSVSVNGFTTAGISTKVYTCSEEQK